MAEPSLIEMMEDEEGVSPAASPAASASEEDEDDEEVEDDGGDEQEEEEARPDEADDPLDIDDDMMAELDNHVDDDGKPGTADVGLYEASQSHIPDGGPHTQATATPGTALAAETPEGGFLSDPGSEERDDRIGEDDIGDDDIDDEGTAHEDAEISGQEYKVGRPSSLPEEMMQKPSSSRDALQSGADVSIAELTEKRKRLEGFIVEQLDSVQQERYELFKRSKIKPPSMKKVVEAVAGRAVHPNVITAMCGVTKMYVGEVVETARSIATRGGHYGALLPSHVYEAYHLLQQLQPGAHGRSMPHSVIKSIVQFACARVMTPLWRLLVRRLVCGLSALSPCVDFTEDEDEVAAG